MSWCLGGKGLFSLGTIIRNYYKVLAGDQQHMFCKKVTLYGWFKHKKTFWGVLWHTSLTKSLFHSAFCSFPNRMGGGRKRPVTRNFVQESYTHVKTQFGVDYVGLRPERCRYKWFCWNVSFGLMGSNRSAVQFRGIH